MTIDNVPNKKPSGKKTKKPSGGYPLPGKNPLVFCYELWSGKKWVHHNGKRYDFKTLDEIREFSLQNGYDGIVSIDYKDSVKV